MWPFGRRNAIGLLGEKLAAKTLKLAGVRILARNYRCPCGEADLVGLAGETLVFAEVKTRRSEVFGTPESSVGRAKQEQYKKVARYYQKRTGSEERPVRFDVIAVVAAEGERPIVRHVIGAFE